MKEKQYRIIEPTKRYGYSQWNGIEKGSFLYDEMKDPEVSHHIIYRVGDIVPFSQLEKWIKQGLHPIYFTEEVIERAYNFYVDIGHMNKIADGHYQVSNDFYNNNKKLKEILSNVEYIDNYYLKGFFISEDNLSEEEEKIIKEIKNET